MAARQRTWLGLFLAGGLAVASGCEDAGKVCAVGTHEELGTCVADPPSCPGGSHLDAGVCVSDDATLVCGEGTFVKDGACVPYDPSDQTPPTTSADPDGGVFAAAPAYVILSADESAVIYYTTDGSEPSTDASSGASPLAVQGLNGTTELRFFAVDAAGNVEEPKSETYEIDSDAPGAIEDFQAVAPDETGVDLSWQSPSDADVAGVVIVRRIGEAVDWTPSEGASYGAQDDVGNGHTVVYVGSGASYHDAEAAAGLNYYAAFAEDDLGHYSDAAEAFVARPLGAQSGQIAFASGVAFVSQQPADFVVNLTQEPGPVAGQVRLFGTVGSHVARPVFNAKLVLSAFFDASPAKANDRYLGNPAMLLGVAALLPGGAGSGSALVQSLGASATIDFYLAEDPMLVLPGSFGGRELAVYFQDTSGLATSRFGLCDPHRPDGYCSYNDALYTADGRRLLLSNRSLPRVTVMDPATFLIEQGPALSAGLGATDGLALSADGKLVYVVLTENAHAGQLGGTGTSQGSAGDENVALVRLDAETLAEIDRLPLVTGSSKKPRGHKLLSVSASGTRAALVVRDEAKLFLLDLSAMSIVNSVDLSATGDQPTAAALTPDGAAIYVAYRDAPELERYDTFLFGKETIVLPDAGLGPTQPGMLAIGPDGRVYLTRKHDDASGIAGLTIVDPADGDAVTSLLVDESVAGLWFDKAGTTLYTVPKNIDAVRAFSLADDAEIDFDDSTPEIDPFLLLGQGFFWHFARQSPF